MGSRARDRTFTTLTLQLHEELLAGETGTQMMGVTALLLFILNITGIILWPGWRRLISGFKVKWKNVHPKRVNFDKIESDIFMRSQHNSNHLVIAIAQK